jgi:hypothetical protein
LKTYDVRDTCAGADAALAVTDNPRHRHILKNYRRHGLLEVSGRWTEILIQEMVVAEPSYRIMEGGRTHLVDGMDAVRGFYRGIAEAGENVFGPLEEQVAVSDWGIFTEGRFASVRPGTHPALAGDDVDPNGMYQISTWVAFAWPYRDGLLVGEHVYEDHNSREVVEVPHDTFVTSERARELLAPLVDQTPLSEIVEGLKLFAR